MITVRRIFAAASLALCMTAFNACVKEEAQEQIPAADENLVEVTFEASSVGVKSTFDSDARKINWELTDKVAVYDGTAKRQFSVTTIEGGVATLKGHVADDATEFYAVYPYSAAGEELPVDGAVNIVLPQEQTLAEGKNFDEDAFVTVGKVEDGSIAFKNVVSLLKINIPADVTSVKLISYSTEKFAGAATAKTDRTTTAGSAASVELKPSAATFTAGEHYIALLPTTFEKGFRIVYTQDSQIGVSKTTAKVVFPVNDGFDVTGSAPSWIPTVIMNETQLRNYFANQDLFGAMEVKLGQNITLASAWTPVALTGKLDGQNHTISGLNVSTSSADAGMFSLIDTDACLSNLTVEGTIALNSASHTSYAGLTSQLKGTMCKVTNKTSVTAASTGTGDNSACCLGGLAGIMRGGKISYCSNEGAVSLGSTSCSGFMGGLVGIMEPAGLIEHSGNTGTLTSNSASMEGLGGIVGIQKAGTVDYCTNSGTLVPTSGKAASFVGGISGWIQNRSGAKVWITNCTNTGEIHTTNTAKAVGGICGVIHRYCNGSSEINNCTNNQAFNVETTRTEFYIGGIVGTMSNPGSSIGDYVNCIKGCNNHGNLTVNKTSTTETVYLMAGGILSAALGEVEMSGNTNHASLSLTDANAKNVCGHLGGIVAKTDDTKTFTFSSNVNRAKISFKTDNNEVHAGGLIGYCVGPLQSSNNINFGDVEMTTSATSNANAFAGGMVGAFGLAAEEKASLVGDKSFGFISSVGRAGLCAGVSRSGHYGTIELKDCVVGGKLYCKTNGFNFDITEANYNTEKAQNNTTLISYYKTANTTFTESNTTYGEASAYESAAVEGASYVVSNW